MNIEEAVRRIYPSITCWDYALPQTWLNKFIGPNYEAVAIGVVWGYPEGSIFGIPLPLTVKADWALGIQSEASIPYRRSALLNA